MTFAADFRGAIVVEAATYGYTFGNFPKMWFIHTPEEAADQHPVTPYYFHTLQGRFASTHYFVSSWLALVFQMVPEREGAYANAREGIAGTLPGETPGWNLNLQSLNVEVEGYAATIHLTMPRGCPQYMALVRLLADRIRAYEMPAASIFAHWMVSNLRRDPGYVILPWLIEDVGALLAWGGAEEDDMPSIEEIETAIDKRIAASLAAPLGIPSKDAVRQLCREAIDTMDDGLARTARLARALRKGAAANANTSVGRAFNAAAADLERAE